MKKPKPFKYPPAAMSRAKTKLAVALKPSAVVQINVRAAKDQLSSLLEEASRGQEIIITSDGKPKAKLVPVRRKQKRFKVDWDLLRSIPVRPEAPTAEEIIRQEREGRP